MASLTPKASRHGRRAAAASAPIEPAIAGTAERAAIERGPDALDPALQPAPMTPAVDAPLDAAVLPEPTLVAEPGVPQPIVTASPILAIEPTALDVVQADAAADRAAAGLEPAADPDGPHAAAAGQPTLTIEGSAADRAAHRLADGALGDDRNAADAAPRRGPVSEEDWDVFWDDLGRMKRPSADEIEHFLRQMQQRDPAGFADVRDAFMRVAGITAVDRFDAGAGSRADAVALVEVVGPVQGRRRAGRSFGPQPQRFLAGELSPDEIAALRADPLLAVSVTDVAEADVGPLYG